MAGGIIFLILFVIYIIYVIDSSIQKKKAGKKALLEAREKAAISFSKMRDSLIKFAKENNKIGMNHYDIEEGGHYVSNLNDKHIAKIDSIIDKYLPNIKSQNPDLFYQSYFKLRLEKQNIESSIKYEILRLPDERNRYIGF